LSQSTTARTLRTALVLLALACAGAAAAQTGRPHPAAPLARAGEAQPPDATTQPGQTVAAHEDPRALEERTIVETLVRLPLAAALGALLAFRPRRRGTPPRDPAVIQTQIILALVGAVVMLVVGASLARAFGIVGAASLVRYRSTIKDPKDAGVMLSCLAIGLAAGVGLYAIAGIATLFMMGVVWLLESQQPESQKDFLLKVKAKHTDKLQDGLESVLKRNGVPYELRSSSQDDLTYQVRLPLTRKTDKLTDAILALGDKETMSVEWADKKKDKEAA
jgi:uncharacterized membrane protein YhiD involved in acid resistance